MKALVKAKPERGIWMEDIDTPRVGPQQEVQVSRILIEGFSCTAMLFERRRAEPKDDLLTALVQAGESNEQLSEGLSMRTRTFGNPSLTSEVEFSVRTGFK